MKGDLLIITPSRGRPGNIARLLDAVHALRKLETHVVVGADDDDEMLAQYHAVMKKAAREGDQMVTGPRKSLAAWTNKLALDAVNDYQYVASFGDDHLPVTRGFDRALCRGIEDQGGTGFAYPWDGTREDIPEAVVMSTDIVRSLAWMCQPGLQHYYVDNVWADLGRNAGCIRHLRAVKVDHIHPGAGKAAVDVTYSDASQKLQDDRQSYLSWRASEMASDVRKIIALRECGLQPV